MLTNSNYSNRSSLIAQWLKDINFNTLTAVNSVKASQAVQTTGIYAISGARLANAPAKGTFIQDGIKKMAF